MAPPERLFGLPGAETMALDPHEVVLNAWEDGDPSDGGPWKVEEWDVQEPSAFLPSSSALLEHIVETVAEDHDEADEWFAEDVANAVGRPEVEALTGALLEVIASRITYRMAGKLLSTQAWYRVGDDFAPCVCGPRGSDGPAEECRVHGRPA